MGGKMGGRRGKHNVHGTMNEFLTSATWREIERRLRDQNPLIFIIMKKSGTVHDVVIKAGFTFKDLSPERILEMKSKEVEPEVKQRIDEIFHKDLEAVHPAPKIIGLEEHEIPVVEPEEITTIPPPENNLPKKEDSPVVVLDEILADTNGEVDLKVGMKIIFEQNGLEVEGQIVDLFEEEGQLLISQAGTKKKEIIDAEKIKRIA